MVSTIGKKIVSLQELPYTLPNLVNFGPETAENGWRVFANLPNFSHWETLPALLRGRYVTDSRPTLARYVVARAYSLEQQNAGRAHAGL